MIPPAVMQIRIRDEYGRGFGLWLPLFVLWPIGLVCLVIALPLLIIAEAVLALVRVAFHPLMAVIALCGLMSAMRGLHVDVGSRQARKSVRISVA